MSSDKPVDSFVHNCIVYGRPGDAPLFNPSESGVLARLDGYVICPREKLQSVAAELCGKEV